MGGTGIIDYVNNTIIDTEIGAQVWIQAQAALTSLVWSGVVAFISFKIVDVTIGLRVPAEAEREGLDTVTHGERAYNM
jgi:Amt family ammonium transporter